MNKKAVSYTHTHTHSAYMNYLHYLKTINPGVITFISPFWFSPNNSTFPRIYGNWICWGSTMRWYMGVTCTGELRSSQKSFLEESVLFKFPNYPIPAHAWHLRHRWWRTSMFGLPHACSSPWHLSTEAELAFHASHSTVPKVAL